jgi:CRISPR-associated exonuclease Cas4
MEGPYSASGLLSCDEHLSPVEIKPQEPINKHSFAFYAMPGGEPDRLISASEVEKWSYCPLSWFLERMDDTKEMPSLRDGIKAHSDEGTRVERIRLRERESRESRRITFAYLSFAVVIVSMSLLLLLLTNVGFLSEGLWQGVVIVVSVVLILISVMFYLTRSMDTGGSIRRVFGGLANRMEGKKGIGGYFPLLSYIFGLILLVNGIVLLRPFGIPDDTVIGAFTISLIVIYVILLVSVIFYFRATRSRKGRKDIKLGMPMLLMLLVSIAVLFVIASEELDQDMILGWVFLGISFMWFIGALVFDLIKSFRTRGTLRGKGDSEDLPLVTIALAASVFTVMAFLSRGNNLEDYNTLSVIIAGLWLVGAVGFFIKGTADRILASNSKEKVALPKRSTIISVDDIGSGKRGKPLVSKKHFLIGSPDVIIEEEGMKVPVEIKTGRSPDRPHFSHIMQLSAYLVLVDVNHSQTTPHGYIEYVPSKGERKRHKVEWDMMTKALVLSKVSEIREAERIGEAHRNHNRAGKCRNCSRRSGCPERLE